MTKSPIVSLIICESVLREASGSVSAIRIQDIIRVPRGSYSARFFVLTILHSDVFDAASHVLQVLMLGWNGSGWVPVANAPPYTFQYQYTADPTAPGAFLLTTEFNLNLSTLGIEPFATYYVQALLDSELITQTPVTLRQG